MKKLLFFLLCAVPLLAQMNFNNNTVKIGATGHIKPAAIYHAYGGFQDSSREVAITQNVWSQVTNPAKSLWGGSEADGITMVNDSMVFAYGGDYVGLMAAVYSGTNANEYLFRVYNATQDAQEGFHTGSTGSGATNYTRFTMPLYFEITAGDTLVLDVTNTSGSNSATFKNAQFVIWYLHE